MWVQISLWDSDFISFGCIPRSGMAGSSLFNFLRNLHTVFHGGCTILHAHQQCTRVPFSPHSHRHVVPLAFLRTAILTSGRGYLIVVDLHFPGDWWCWASFRVPVGHLFVQSLILEDDFVSSSPLLSTLTSTLVTPSWDWELKEDELPGDEFYSHPHHVQHCRSFGWPEVTSSLVFLPFTSAWISLFPSSLTSALSSWVPTDLLYFSEDFISSW